MTKEKGIPQIRFSGFTDTWEQREAKNLFVSTADKGHPELPVLSATQDRGMIRRDENSINIYHDKKNEEGYKRVLPGQFVIHLRSFQGGFAHSAIEGITSPAYTVFGFSELEKHNPNFWKYVFTSKEFIRRLETVTYGIRDGRSISYDEFLTMDFVFPTQDEQTKIANYLDTLDRLITLHQRKYDKLTKVKKAMLEKMFPENGSSYPEIRFKGFTDAWEQRKFSELTEIRSASRVHKEEWQSSGVPFYRSSDVMAALNGTENEKAFISEELYEKLSAVSGKLEKGDVLVTGGGSVGKPYIVPNNEPLYTKDADLLWIKNNENLDPYFVYTFFFSPTFTDYLNSVSHVGTIAHYTITQLGETPITLPCVSEQQKIGDYFRNLDSLITLHQRK